MSSPNEPRAHREQVAPPGAVVDRPAASTTIARPNRAAVAAAITMEAARRRARGESTPDNSKYDVLVEIFSYADPMTLRLARQVCVDWNFVIVMTAAIDRIYQLGDPSPAQPLNLNPVLWEILGSGKAASVDGDATDLDESEAEGEWEVSNWLQFSVYIVEPRRRLPATATMPAVFAGDPSRYFRQEFPTRRPEILDAWFHTPLADPHMTEMFAPMGRLWGRRVPSVRSPKGISVGHFVSFVYEARDKARAMGIDRLVIILSD